MKARFLPRQRHVLTVTLGSTCLDADVSAAGFTVETASLSPLDSRVEGTVRIGDRAYRFCGEVSWARPGDPRLSVRCRMGVRFTQVPPEFYPALRELDGP